MTECPHCGTQLERPKPGWIEVYRRRKDDKRHVICVGRLTKLEWLEGESRWFNWLEEGERLDSLKGEYCPKGHLNMKDVEEALL